MRWCRGEFPSAPQVLIHPAEGLRGAPKLRGFFLGPGSREIAQITIDRKVLLMADALTDEILQDRLLLNAASCRLLSYPGRTRLVQVSNGDCSRHHGLSSRLFYRTTRCAWETDFRLPRSQCYAAEAAI